MKVKRLHVAIAIGASVGLVAAFMQLLEKITLLKHADQILSCDINSVFSCSNVLNAWQSSVFGFPNAVMCIILFTVFAVTSLVIVTGGTVPRRMRLAVQGLALFMLGFALWFLEQSIFDIRSLCIFCIFCFVGLLVINWGWLRGNAADLPIKDAWKRTLQRGIEHGADTFGWILLGMVVLGTMVIKFI